MAKLDTTKVFIADTLTVPQFAQTVRDRMQDQGFKYQQIYYHLTENSEVLDYIEHNGLKLIVMNGKAKKYTPGIKKQCNIKVIVKEKIVHTGHGKDGSRIRTDSF